MSDEVAWTTGDVVILRSQPQRMTVGDVKDNGDVHCTWIKDGVQEHGVFKSGQLEKYVKRVRRTLAAYQS